MKKFALIGRSLAHSYSPEIQRLLGVTDYALVELAPEALQAFIRENTLDGFNVTIPYKEAVMYNLHALSSAATRIGSVNTVVRMPDGTLEGHNTDYFGFSRLLGSTARFRGRKALVLGSGGASHAARVVLNDVGARVVVISRTGEDNYSNLDRHADASLIVNATPVGMYPHADASPIDISRFPNLELVLDMVYNPARTRLLLQAEALGIENRNGMCMLAAQALQACRLWGMYSSEHEAEDIARVAASVARGKRNLALLGMPGCGKTSIGKRLSTLTGRELIDTDEVIAKQEGMPVSEIIESRGELAFRELETRVLSWAALESGKIIATGGGVVTRDENHTFLMQNSLCVYIERDLSLLPSDGRPLTRAAGVSVLYQARAPLYEAWCEKRYTNTSVEDTARRIIEECL